MPWVRIDDGLPDHAKLDALPAEACWLHICGMAYSSRNLTNGFVPAGKASGLLAGKKSPAATKRLVERLVASGLWEVRDAGYQVHDYLDYNPSREEVLKKREATRQRVEKARAAKTGKASGNGLGNALHEGEKRVSNGATENDVTLQAAIAPAPAPAPDFGANPGSDFGTLPNDRGDPPEPNGSVQAHSGEPKLQVRAILEDLAAKRAMP